jgi:hypothetical protein
VLTGLSSGRQRCKQEQKKKRASAFLNALARLWMIEGRNIEFGYHADCITATALVVSTAGSAVLTGEAERERTVDLLRVLLTR